MAFTFYEVVWATVETCAPRNINTAFHSPLTFFNNVKRISISIFDIPKSSKKISFSMAREYLFNERSESI